MVFRRWGHLVHILALISSSSARLSHTRRLSSAKPKTPLSTGRGEKNQLRRQVATVKIRMVCISQLDSGGCKPYTPRTRLLISRQLRLRRLSSAVGIYNVSFRLELRKGRSSEPRFALYFSPWLCEGSTLGLAELFGNIKRHAVSEKSVTLRI